MLVEKSEPLPKAVGVLMELSADEQTRMIYEAQEKARRDEEARKDYAIKTKQVEITKKLLLLSISIDKIVEATGLTRDEVEELRLSI